MLSRPRPDLVLQSEALELQAMREHKHVFKKAKLGMSLPGPQQGKGQGREQGGGQAKGSRAADKGKGKGKGKGTSKAMLSFADDEEDQ